MYCRYNVSSPSLSIPPVPPGVSSSTDLRSPSPLSPPFSLLTFRYSLSGGIKTVPVPYLPADTTRSVSSTSEYGAARQTSLVSGRPNSRSSKLNHLRNNSGQASSSGSNSGEIYQDSTTKERFSLFILYSEKF